MVFLYSQTARALSSCLLVENQQISGRAASLFARMVGGAPADTKGPASSEVIELAPGAGFERPAR